MKLWTTQPIAWYEKLQKDGIIFGDPKHSTWCIDREINHFRFAYNWLSGQMDKRIGMRPFRNALPIWAWYRYERKRPKPDLRYAGHLHRGEFGVRLEIEKQDKDVLLSDFMLWTHPLNKWYIPKSEQDDKLFDSILYPFLEANNLKFGNFDKYPAHIQEKIKKSWELIFDLDFADDYIASEKDEKIVQATFWSLRVDEVREVTFFKAR